MGDHRRLVLGGSATELTHCERPRAAPRRSSEGGYTLRRKSSSSSNAADDPTSSENSTSCSTSSSSSSESGNHPQGEVARFVTGEELVDREEISDQPPESIDESSKLSTEKKELEEFYDSPTPESSASSTNKHERKTGYHVAKDSPKKVSSEQDSQKSLLLSGRSSENEDEKESHSRVLSPDVVVQDKSALKSTFLRPDFVFEPEIIHKANPIVDEADIEVIPSAVGAFRRLSEEEFIASLNIHEAARKGDLHVVKLLTKKDPKQMETVDERGWTPIHVAAAHGHTEVVKFLALEGAHLAALDPSSYTPLHLAAMNGHNPCLEVLLSIGVDLDSITAEGFTPLHLAVMNVQLECIQTLLQWGSSLEKRDALGRNVQDMVEEYNLEDVAALLRRFHKQLHKFKHILDMMQRNEDRSSAEIPREFMDILASIAEESGTE
ncbi:receptor-interacting serine/threonine-protein kinase 4-like [Uloborus diversus]|uniref:receptor-interacting serine/threonine-protein kinase 4-like n=1 Tax=Uloborus diversus TaxID=327109 RepID=UPI00240A5F7A|nr:receptor-interacting serine/threonine-protein kinase 4-like [Uloborus diversus]